MHQVKWKGVVGITDQMVAFYPQLRIDLIDLRAPKFSFCSHRYTCMSSPHAQFDFIIHPPLPVSPSFLISAQVGSCAPGERPN